MKSKPTKTWFDDVALDLRMRKIKGTAIGDALAAVESHCQETGETPEEAFGDPHEYAQSLEFGESSHASTSRASWTSTIVGVACGLIAIMMVTPMVRALLSGGEPTFTWGVVASLPLIGLTIWLVMTLLPLLMGKGRVKSVLFGSLLGGASIGIGIVGVVWTTVAFSLPTWVTGTLIFGLLAVSVYVQRRNRLRGADPIVDPRRPDHPGIPLVNAASDWVLVIAAVGLALLALVPEIARG